MTIQEILKSKNIDDQVINDILEQMKQNKIYTASEENLDVRYSKLKADNEALTSKDAESQKLISELQKATQSSQEIQTKIADYEATILEQEKELEEARKESALKIGLLSAGAKASDIDYLIFKIKKDSDFSINMNDDGEIKGLDEKVKSIKTQYPNQFLNESKKQIDEKKLDKSDNKDIKMSKEDFNKLSYKARVELRNSDPDLYKTLSN